MSNRTEAKYDMEAHKRKVERTLRHETIQEKNMRLYSEDCSFEILDIDLYRQSQRDIADVISGNYEAAYRLEYKQMTDQLDIRAMIDNKKRYKREVITEVKVVSTMAIVWAILTTIVAYHTPVVTAMLILVAIFIIIDLGLLIFKILNINRGL